jgi:hypothetical protein
MAETPPEFFIDRSLGRKHSDSYLFSTIFVEIR